MDLQAILDAPSSDEDNVCLRRYASSYHSGGGGSGRVDVVCHERGGDDAQVDVSASLSVSATVSNLSSVSSVKDRSLTGGASAGGREGAGGVAGMAVQTTRSSGSGILVARESQEREDEHLAHGGPLRQTTEDDRLHNEVLSGSSSSPRALLGKGKGKSHAMDGVDILRDLEGEELPLQAEDIVGQILRSSAGRGGHLVGGANLELERILREADADDDDDDDEFVDNDYLSPSRNGLGSKFKPNLTTNSNDTDLLLQSILKEADDEDDNSLSDATDPLSPLHKQFNNLDFMSSSGRSISGSSNGFHRSGDNGVMRHLTSPMSPPTMPLSHAMEVDAILNSVRLDDEEDGDDFDLDVRDYSNKLMLAQRMLDTDDDDTDENETDIGLNFNFSMGGGAIKISSPLQDAKYDKNISMQYPLTRKEEKESCLPPLPQKEVLCHPDVPSLVENQCCLTDYTAKFLKDIGTQLDGRLMDEPEGGNEQEVLIGRSVTRAAAEAEDENRGDRLSALCMQRAEEYERRLLKPNSRNVVSPLTVKRRMKPKVELMTKSRLSNQPSLSQQTKQQSSQQSISKQSWQQPRFGFSGGIIQSKSMAALGSQLRKGQLSGGSGGDGNWSGLPTALAVNSKFIAVGDQRGQVWVFDLFEQLKIVLGEGGGSSTTGAMTTEEDPAANSSAAASIIIVTSIDLSLHGDFLLAGYGSGHVALWDILKGTVLKRIVDLHTSSISSARFTSIPGTGNYGGGGGGDRSEIGAVSVDAGGLVNKLVFSRGWLSTYSVDHECLLDGTAGQILAMDALPPLDSERGLADVSRAGYHPSVSRIVLIALSSGRSSFAVSVEPKVSVLHRWARPTTERIDPTIAEEDRLTQVSTSTSASTHAPTHVSGYAASYASSHLSTSTYEPPKKSSSKQGVDTTPVPYLPCLSWGWALVSGGGHAVTPILARAWGCCLQFLRANFPPCDPHDYAADDDTTVHWPAFGTHDEFDASAPVVALNWLGKRSLVYLTLTNEFIIIDTVIMTMQERLDFSGLKLVYAEFALSRRHNISQNGCSTFMNSIRSSDNRLLVLCQEEIKEITVLGMRRQIMSLEDGGQWLEALALALDHYESTIKSQEDGCRRDAALSNQSLMTLSPDPDLLTEDEIWMAELLMRYLILAIDNAPESSAVEFSFSNNKLPDRSRLNLAESHYEMLSGVCMEFCIVTRRLDLLFGPVFRCFYEARYINVFLDVMETYVLNDRLKYIAPEAMVLFVAHCKDMKDLSTVERCLLHMDCHLMDFDSILTLLKDNELYTGLFHVYANGGLDDFSSPLEILLEAMFDCSADTTASAEGMYGSPGSKFEQYGYKAILYLRYCFSGRTFPKGDAIVPEERIQTLRPELFSLLLREIGSSPSQQGTIAPQNRNKSFRGIRALPFPYLRALILIDAKSFLESLAVVLDDPEARFEEASRSQMHALGSWEVEYDVNDIVSHDEDSYDTQLLPNRQHLVNILSSIIMSDSLVDTYHFGSRKQIELLSIKNCYLDFLEKYLKNCVITVPKDIMGEVFARLCKKGGEYEKDVLSLLHALPRSSYKLDEILYTVESVQMTRAALFLHKVGVTASIDREGMADKCQHHFSRAIDCYLKDKDVKKGVFAYVKKECSGSSNASVRNVVLRRLPELVSLDATRAAHLVGEVFVEDIDSILSSLKGIDSGRVEYDFLHAIISGDLKVEVTAQELSANLTLNHHHMYLLLMTNFEPELVYQYLSTSQNYRLKDALKLCQERKITDASAYLLERMGDVSGALKLMLENLDSRMITLRTILQHSSGSRTGHPSRKSSIQLKSSVHQNEIAEKEISRIKKILSAVLDLCERNKNDHLTLENEPGPLLWFHVLDRLVNAKNLLHLTKDSTSAMSTVLSELLLMTMQRMISNVSLYELIHKITRDHARSDLGEFREMLVSMLKTYSSELDVCSSAVDVMFYDIQQMSYEKKRLKVQGSFVRECPPAAAMYCVPKNSFLDVDLAGNYEVRRNVNHPSTKGQTHTINTVSLLQHRRSSDRRPRNIRRSKNINLMMSSEYLFSPKGVVEAHDIGIRRVGSLSEAQHVGGIF